MAKDNAVQNQKVFVTLESVLDFQRVYLRMAAISDNNTSGMNQALHSKRVMEQMIDLLGLPIQKA